MKQKMTNRAVLLAVALIANVPVCAISGEEPAIPALSIDSYPIVDGSTSAQPLGTLLACRLTRTAFAWGSHPFDGTRRLYPITQAYDPLIKLPLDFPTARFHMPTNIQQRLARRVQHRGTHESYTNLIAGSADLIIVAREPSEDELTMARSKGVRVRYEPIALDAFVFIVNTNNPVRNLSIEQIREIYTGAITNWAQFGGATAPINAYQRNKNSGSQEKMEKLVMKGLKMIQSGDLEVPIAMIGPFNAIRHDKKGVGYTVQYYDTYMTRIPEISTISVNGIPPDAESIRRRRYPFVSEVVVAWLDDLPKGSTTEAVRDWLLTQDGQQLVAESGYIPVK
jgi:phosphate transport system substrate-binding protein